MAARKPPARATRKAAPKPEPEVFDTQPSETVPYIVAAQNRMREVWAKRGKKS